MSSAPVSFDIRPNTNTDSAEMRATSRNAGAKSRSPITLSPRNATTSSTVSAQCDASRHRELLAHGGERGGAAHAMRIDVGKTDRHRAGELERAEEAAGEQDREHDEDRGVRREQRAGGDHGGGDER